MKKNEKNYTNINNNNNEIQYKEMNIINQLNPDILNTKEIKRGMGEKNKNKEMITTNDMSDLLLKLVKNNSIIRHNIDSFNEFIDTNGLKHIICNIFKITEEIEFEEKGSTKNTYRGKEIKKLIYIIRFTDVKFDKPRYINQITNDYELLTPNIARLKNLTYSSEITIDCEIEIKYYLLEGGEPIIDISTINNLPIGKYPIMLKSNICNLYNATKEELINIYKEDPNDNGGYFIINGVEWTIDTSESILFNSFRVYNNQYNNEVSRGEFISKPGDGFENSREIIIRLLVNNLITIQLVGCYEIYEEYHIPFFLIFRLYGVMSDIEIFKYILLDFEEDNLYYKIKHIIESNMLYTDKGYKYDKIIDIYDHEKLMIEFGKIVIKNKNKYTDNKIIELLYTLLDKCIFPHIGEDSSKLTRKKKLTYLGILIRKLILANINYIPETDRDSYNSKRLHSAGISYSKSFKTIFRSAVISNMKKQFKYMFIQTQDKSQINIEKLLNHKVTGYEKLEDAIEKSIKTGNKEIIYDKSSKPVSNKISSQMLNRKNELNTLSTLRVIHTSNTSSSNQTKRSIEMRSVHPTYVGFICPTATADTGDKVGLSKQIAITALITLSSDSEYIKKLIYDKIIQIDIIINNSQSELLKQYTNIYVNGDLQGCIKENNNFIKEIREMRLNKSIHPHTTIYFNILLNEINIWTDYGRIVRPLVKVYNNLDEINKKDFKFRQYIKLTKDHIYNLINKKINITDIENDNIIEYISAEEQENCYLAYNINIFYENENNHLKQYTHVDIEEALFGITALTSPFLNHTAANRGSYQTNQAKQSCGWYCLNPYDRYDKKKFFQTYCELPIVKTITSSLTYPNGVNLTVAMMCYSGYNQEDSAIINRNLIDNNFLCGYAYTYEIVKITDHNSEFIRRIKNTDILEHKSKANGDYLNDIGIIQKGSIIESNTILVSKLQLINKKENKYMDKSLIYNGNEVVVVDDIEIVYYNPQENKIDLVKIRLKSYRKLLEGDKLSTRCGNKNIISKIMNPADLPYTLNGEIPDMIVNPQGIPTRMCVGQLLESIFAKLGVVECEILNGTAFSKFDINTIKNKLEENGYDGFGLQRMICGKTGKIIKALIFYTPVYIQHIMKFSIEELYVINHESGPKDEVTRQPREGKTNMGGLKIGEMEKDVLAAHGSTLCIQEKFINSSDFIYLYYCKNCGAKVAYNNEHNINICKLCEVDSDIVKIGSTYITNILYHYLHMLGVDMRFLFK